MAAERDFLLARLMDGSADWVGASSNAMVAAAITGLVPRRFPLDTGDMRRCEETYMRAPKHLQREMEPILQQFRERLAGRWLGAGR